MKNKSTYILFIILHLHYMTKLSSKKVQNHVEKLMTHLQKALKC